MLERGTAIELLTFSVRLNLCRALSFRSFRCCLAMLSMRACFEKSLPCLNRRKALPSATDLGVDKCKLKKWRELGGDALEPVLASGAVALLDAQWIISHAEAGGVLNHRQALPKEAFLSLADLVEATGDLASRRSMAARREASTRTIFEHSAVSRF